MDSEMFAEFCRREWFRGYVRDIVREGMRDELLLNKLFEDSHVSRKLEIEIPRRAENYLSKHVPDMVSTQLYRHVPNFLSQNAQMRDILQAHSESLEVKLKAECEKILEEIVNDPEYHKVNECYFRAFESKSDQAIREMNRLGAEKLARVEKNAQDVIQTFSSDIRRMHQLEERMKYLHGSVIMAIVSISGIILYLALKTTPF
jgi:hypothetical protein